MVILEFFRFGFFKSTFFIYLVVLGFELGFTLAKQAL
jgi:uncharacterized membrane protein